MSHSQLYSKDHSIKDICPKIGEMRLFVRSADKSAVVRVKMGSNYVYTINGKELASVKQQKDLGLL